MAPHGLSAPDFAEFALVAETTVFAQKMPGLGFVAEFAVVVELVAGGQIVLFDSAQTAALKACSLFEILKQA